MKTIIINNAGPRGPQGPQGDVGPQGPSGSDANVPPLIISSSKQFTDITSPFTGSFTGSFAGDGSNLINVPASGVVGLNLSQISSGTATASISETTGFFVNTHITASGDISASGATITALTGSFNHIITDDETLEFRSKTSGTRIGQLKFNTVNGLEIQDPLGARAKVRAARGEFLSLEAGPVGMNSLGSITASNSISASSNITSNIVNVKTRVKAIGSSLEFAGDELSFVDAGSVSQLFKGTAAGAFEAYYAGNKKLETTATGVNITGNVTGSVFSGSFVGDGSGLINVTAPGTLSGSAQIATEISGAFGAPSASFSTRITANKDLITTNTNNISINNSNISNNASLITGITSSLSTTGRMVFVGANGTLTSEAGFEYNATTNQLSVDNLNVNHLTSSFITSSRIFTSGSNIFGDDTTDTQTLIGTTKISGSAQVTGSLNTSGIITGDGSGLTNIPASGIVGLNLSQIASGSATASISPDKGLIINTDTKITGSLTVSGSFNAFTLDSDNIVLGKGAGADMLAGATNNTIIGPNAGANLTTGDNNVFLGQNAGAGITDYHYNTAIGYYAMGSTSDASTYNVAVGYTALRYGSGVKGNIGIGYQALQGVGGMNGDYNIGIGYGAGDTIRDGLNNVFVGKHAGGSINDGDSNIGIGITAGNKITDGNDNICIGNLAGRNLVTGTGNIILGTSASLASDLNGMLVIGSGSLATISASLATGNILLQGDISSSATSTASFGTYVGDGSQLSGISTTPFPFSGSAVITGSLTVSGSVVDFMSASAINLDIEKIPLVNPMVEYFDVGAITGSGTTITLPNSLTYVSSSVYEYLEVFVNGLRLRYNRDFVPMSNTSIKYNITIVSGSEVTYKSLKRP